MKNLDQLDALIEPMRRAARIPGLALAIVANGETIFSKGYGLRNLAAQRPMTAHTVYPIASTSKAMNATLLGMLIDEGRLAWDAPVQTYWPQFRLGDSFISAQVTLRDLVAMRTGLPRHDWLWIESAIGRSDFVERLRYLELSAGFRARFQYNNLTTTAAGHIAEIVTGKRWEALVRERIVEPLGMSMTGFVLPEADDVTLSYHENTQGELLPTRRLATEVSAPSGGAIHSTVEDMARWAAFNLNSGKVDSQSLIQSGTLKEIHSPWMVVGAAPESISPHCAYGGGWFVDTYNGRARVSHGGYLHDVNSDVSLFPDESLGIVSCTNFGSPRFARFINEHVFDLMRGLSSQQTLEEKLAQNEKKLEEARKKKASVRRVPGTTPSHALDDYLGSYTHPGHGIIEIRRSGERLILQRGQLALSLRHWHYDAWVAEECEVASLLPALFEHANPILFETGADGEITGLAVRLEPAVSALRFAKESRT